MKYNHIETKVNAAKSRAPQGARGLKYFLPRFLRSASASCPVRGAWIGIGGKFEEGESPEECALRETKEETGLALTSYRYRGIVTFVSDKWESEYMHLFTADGFEGTLKDCDEGELAWIKKKDLLALPAWEGDKIFLRLLDENIPFFSLKLRYEGETLAEAKLNGKALEVRHG